MQRYPLVLVNGYPQELPDLDRIIHSANVVRSATEPANAVEGDLWLDTTNSTLKAFDGTAFVNVFASGYAVSAGDGIDVAANVVSVDLKTGGGLVIESTELAVDLGAGSITGTLSTADGGTGQTSYTDGQLLIGNTATGSLTKAVLTAGSNISITNGNGSIQVSASTASLIDGGNFTNGTSIVTTSNTFDGGDFT